MKTLDQLSSDLKRATLNPFTFFGENPDSTLRAIKIASHPDRWPGREDEAVRIFTNFSSVCEVSKKSESILGYQVAENIARGDLCNVFRGVKGDTHFIIKVPRVKAGSVMKSEFNLLNRIRENARDAAKPIFPAPIEMSKEASVFDCDTNTEPLTAIRGRYPDGLGGRHIGWIFKRILLALTWTHAAGVVHGAITPDHILVNKVTHGVRICGWIHAGENGSPIKIIPKAHIDLYPEQAKQHKKLTTDLDIVMAARVAELLAGSDVPRRQMNFIRAIQSEGNIKGADAWTLHQEYDEILKEVYGKPKFVELV